MSPKNPFFKPDTSWAVFTSRLQMSTAEPGTNREGIRWSLSDMKSVEMHASGRWLIVVPEDGETWWLRVGDDVQTIEFNPFHHAEVKPELMDSEELP